MGVTRSHVSFLDWNFRTDLGVHAWLRRTVRSRV